MTPELAQTIAITTGYGPQTVEVEWQEGGLAVHLDHTLNGFEVDDEVRALVAEEPDGWTITHVRSGFRVRGGIALLCDAIDLAQALLPCGDWTRPFAEVVGDDALYAATVPVMREHGLTTLPARVAFKHRRRILRRYAPVPR